MRKKQLALFWVAAVFLVPLITQADLSIDQLVRQAGISEGDVAIRDVPAWRGAHKILIWDIGMDLDGIIEESADVEIIAVETMAEALQYVRNVDAIVGFCDDELFAVAERLVWVQIYWAGAERCLSVADVANGDVMMTNMQKMSSPVIAEHAIAMMLSLARNLPQFVHAMESRVWADREAATEGMTAIAGKKLLVVGLGGIGTEVARLGAALGMRVSATRNSSRNGPDFIEYVGLSHELHELAADSDVVVNALPLTDATNGLFGGKFFAAVKPGAIFINVGRGKTVITADLIAALESGQISGAGLDVTEPEPLPVDSPLWSKENVIITPHVAGTGAERDRHRILLIENLRRYIAGDRLLNVVDPEKGY